MFGLEFYEDSVHTIKCELYFDAVLYDECTIYLDFHKWVLQNLDAIFYAGEIAPFIWTIINGCFKILDETSASLWISFSGLDENLWNFSKNLGFIGTYGNIFTTTIFILLL